MRKVVNYPDPILRVVTKDITNVDKTLLDEMADLTYILKSAENGAGLAAPQIGVEKRFFGLKNSDNDKVTIYINPVVAGVFGKKTFPVLVGGGKNGEETKEDFLEGCLSFPGFWGTVKRYLKIDVEWKELEEGVLVLKKKTLQGFDAIVFQHELDHLDGVLFIDHIKADQGKFFKQMGKEMVKWDVEKVISGSL